MYNGNSQRTDILLKYQKDMFIFLSTLKFTKILRAGSGAGRAGRSYAMRMGIMQASVPRDLPGCSGISLQAPDACESSPHLVQFPLELADVFHRCCELNQFVQ